MVTRYVSPRANPRRDKRYNYPVLSISLSQSSFPMTSWDQHGFFVTDYEVTTLAVGDLFSGVFSFRDGRGKGQFTARAMTTVPNLKAKFTEITPESLAILNARDTGHNRSGVMMTPVYPTVDWSLSGFVVGQYTGKAKVNETIKGFIGVDKFNRFGTFEGTVLRIDRLNRRVAVRFTSMANATFDLLEKAVTQFLHSNSNV